MEQPATGDYTNTWATPVNSDWSVIDATFGSSTSIAFTNANVTLTVAQAAFFQIVCTGTLSGNVQLILPGTIGGRRVIFNQCTGAFTLTVLNGAGDTGGGVVVGQGFQTPVVLTAAQAYYDAYASTPPGTLLPFAGVTAPPGFLLCFGQAISRTTYAQLFAALSTTWGGSGSNFNLPDLRGRLLAGADNMGGSAAGRLTGYTVGTTGGAQTNTAATTLSNTNQLPQFTPSGTVTTSLTNTGATLGGTAGATLQNGATGATQGTASISFSASSTFSGNSIGSASPSAATSAAFSVVQPTAAINYMIRT